MDVSFFNQDGVTNDLDDFRQFITLLTALMPVSSLGTRVAIVEFAEGVFTRLRLSQGTSRSAITGVLPFLGDTEIENPGESGRVLSDSLDTIIAVLNNPSENRIPDSRFPNTIIYITAGLPYGAFVAQLSEVQRKANTIKGQLSTVRPVCVFPESKRHFLK